MGKIWSVDVSINGENILTIGSDWLSGKSELTTEDEGIIKDAADCLLSFIGVPLNQINATDAICICPRGSNTIISCPIHGEPK